MTANYTEKKPYTPKKEELVLEGNISTKNGMWYTNMKNKHPKITHL